MPISTTLFPGRYIQGKDVLSKLGEEAARLGDKAFIICDPYVMDNILPGIKKSIEQSIKTNVEKFAGECSDEEINRLSEICQIDECNIVVGIGGGKTFDTAKSVAYKLKLPVVIAPTIASTDAPCNALAVIYTKESKFKRYLVLPQNPNIGLVDTSVIVNAPVRFLVSGMGDALSTYFEAESCRIKYATNMSGRIGSMTAYALAKLCYETLIKYGFMAKVACENNLVTPELEKVVEANTLLSGLGFESGGLAAAHAIHNGLTVLEETHKYYHGEKVAYGTLTSLFMTDKDPCLIDKVYTFCESVGLPTKLADIGLGKASDEELIKAAKAACADGETIYNELVPVSPDLVFASLKAADAYGKSRSVRK